MIGPIEFLRRQASARAIAPMMLIVIGAPTRPDPIAKRAGGTAGVIAIPSASAPSTAPTRADLVAIEGRRDARAARGRVLYSAGHAPRDTAATHAARKQPCADQHVVQSRAGTNPSPTI